MAKARTIMFLGTGSDVGKSVLTAAFCRILYQDGYRVVPFKAQNMALNSFITPEGGEMGRAQVVQAEAARISPHVDMNPILLKPSSQMGSQVIVQGKVLGNMKAKTYYEYKKKLLPVVKESFGRLANQYDIVVLEGAGSAVELNLKEHDLVNMAMAEMADAPVILIGDIDRGGIFAAIIGSMELFGESERKRVKGFIINKFRGDPSLFEEGVRIIEEKTSVPVFGIIPYFDHFHIPQEDSVALQKRRVHETGISVNQQGWSKCSLATSPSRRLYEPEAPVHENMVCNFSDSRGCILTLNPGITEPRDQPPVRIGVIKLPYISNYTDFDSLEQESGVQLVYFDTPDTIPGLNCVIIPGSKTTIHDLRFLFRSGLASALKDFIKKGKPVIGICGGYQMLGEKVLDPDGIESETRETDGLGFLPAITHLLPEKVTSQVKARPIISDWHADPNETLTGYEIHMGFTEILSGAKCLLEIFSRNGVPETARDGAISDDRLVWGTYLHGIFDNDNLRRNFLNSLKKRAGFSDDQEREISFAKWKDQQYDLLADHVRKHVDMDAIYRIMGLP